MKANVCSQTGLLPALVIMSMLVVPFLPAHAQGQESPPVSSPAEPSAPVVVRLHVQDRDDLNAVAGELDIWEAHPEDLYVVAAVTPDQYEWLETLGYRLEIDAAKTADYATRASLDPRFHYFDDFIPNENELYVVNFLQDVNTAYPDLTDLYDIGDAWMADQPGEYDRDIWVLRVTNEDPAYGAIEDKPVFFLFATIHAREVTVPELAIRYVRYLTEGYDGEGGYGVDPDVTWLVNHNVAYVLVMQNPDGHVQNEEDTGAYWRKNMDWDDGCGSSSSWGVDLNRNHSFLWGCCGGSSGDPCSTTYRGPDRGSEPETQAFESYFATVMPDQNGPNGDDEIPPAAPSDATGIFISLHSTSDIVIWPWGFTGYGDPPNYAQLRTIGRKFAYYNGYDPIGSIWYDVDGATDDWTYGKFGIASYTFEVGPGSGSCAGFFPEYGCIDGIDGMPRSFWDENRPAFIYAHKIARTPYMTSFGPDTQDMSVLPNEVSQGTPVDLRATVVDHRYEGDLLVTVGAAEYFIDVPGEDGTGIAMTAIDGDWGDLTEEVTASVDTAGLGAGQHYLLVHGQGTFGQWGPFTAVFLNVSGPCDFDSDGGVDLDDYAIFADCLAGPGESAPPDGCSPDQFTSTDMDEDLDVDVADFWIFQSCLGGSV
jgi:carboxypeptidase T